MNTYNEKWKTVKMMADCIKIAYRGNKVGVDVTTLVMFILYYSRYKNLLGLSDEDNFIKVDETIMREMGFDFLEEAARLRHLRNRLAHLYDRRSKKDKMKYFSDDLQSVMIPEINQIEDVAKLLEGAIRDERKRRNE